MRRGVETNRGKNKSEKQGHKAKGRESSAGEEGQKKKKKTAEENEGKRR